MSLLTFELDQLPRRAILAVDIKSFFASVECALRGLDPLHTRLVVVSDLNRPGGVILAASPAVKKAYGITTANRLFEVPRDGTVKIVEPHMSLYLSMNKRINELFEQYTEQRYVQAYSIDESFLDITGSVALMGDAVVIARKIKQTLFARYQLHCSIGIGDNPLLAKLAMDNAAKKTSDGIAYWNYENIPQTVWQIKQLTDFWGIGRRTALRLEKHGYYSVKSLAHADIDILKKEFGILGEQLYYHANGIDYTRIGETAAPLEKSYSKNQILFRDYHEKEEVRIIILEMVEDVAERLREQKAIGDIIHLSVGNSRNTQAAGFSRRMKISEATNVTSKLIQAFSILFDRYYQGEAVRSVNVSVGGIRPDTFAQINLFENSYQLMSHQKLDQTVDDIRQRFGKSAIMRAVSYTEAATAIQRTRIVAGHRG
ncbi:DinB/UmuC family translesion DNA polymerase [Listeria ilorinensis]|uniref:Y-family DNA polymerase n=1 Tax=Listeria ilorinensis TaxID=2867439 RepID=UPI001EF73306|nr:excinuclease ABC subunit A [Listeria ilorinensis]